MKTQRFTTLVALLLLGMTAWADVEPNNSIAEAESASLGTLTGDLGTAGDFSDYYVVNLPVDGELTLTLTTSGSLQARTVIYYGDGSAPIFGGFVTGGTVVQTRDCLAAGDVFIWVDQNSGADSYSLDIALTPVPEANDPEPNNSFSEASPMAFEGTVTGHLGYNNPPIALDQDDYYATIPVEEGKIEVTLTTTNSLQARVILYNNAGSVLSFGTFVTAGTVSYTIDCIAPDTVYLRVDYNAGCGGYTLSYDWTAPAFAGDPEPNNTLSQAISLDAYTEVTGRLGYVNLPNKPADLADYYGSAYPTNGNITLRLITDNTLQARLILYNKDRTTLTFGSFVLNDTTELVYNCLREDSIFVYVDQNSGCGSYRLSYVLDSPDVAADLEPNNTFDDAIFLGQGIGSARTGHIGFVNGFSDQDDYYFGVPTADGRVSIRIINDGAQQSRVILYNDDRVTLSFSSFSTDTVVFDYDCVAAGDTIYFLVDNNSGCGGYQLSYEVIPNPLPNDPEPNNSIPEAKPLPEGLAGLRTGHLGYANGTTTPADNDDYYRIKPSDDGKITITTISTNSLQSRILLYSRSGTFLTSSSFVTADTVSLIYDCLLADTAYVRIDRNAGCGGYQLWYEMENPVQSNDNEPNNVLAEATVLASNTAQEGHLGYANSPTPVDGDDWYVYNPQDTGDLAFQVILTNTLQARLLLYNAAGSFLTSTPFATADTINFLYSPPNGDTLYVLVDWNNGCGGYTVEVDNGCEQPTNLNETLIISIGAQVDWDDSPGALAYNIQGKRAAAANFATASGITASNYRAFPLQSCNDYNYRVESICATRTSGYTPLRTFTTLCAPFCPALSSVTVVSTGSTTATIGWAPSIVNTGAQLQYTPSAGGPTQTATAPGGTNTISLTGLTPSTSYDFDVRQSCYDGGLSPFVSGSFSTTTLKQGTGIELVLFPNPANETLYVQGLSAEAVVAIHNAQGQLVLQTQASGGSDAIDVSDLAPGWYSFRILGEAPQTHGFTISR